MNTDTKTRKRPSRYVALKFPNVSRHENASTEEALMSADKIMRDYDEAFMELAK